MEVETYEIESMQEVNQTTELSEEWIKIVDSCALEGQKDLIKKKEGTEETSIIPFPELSEEQERIFAVLCPQRTDVKKFSRQPIPLRVLALVSLCYDKIYFPHFEVWSDKESDPVLIGKSSNDWQAKKYLIARWGNELDNFTKLKEKAFQKKRITTKATLEKEIAEKQSLLSYLDAAIIRWFEGDFVAGL